MAFPRRCSKCRCYVADQLPHCPRCNSKVPSRAAASGPTTKEERAAARAKAEAKLPVIRHKKVKWKPSERAVEAHKLMLEELKRKIARADTARVRNALRAELRLARATIQRGEQKGSFWRYEFRYELGGSVVVFISPKGRRYVTAGRDEPATLLMQNRLRGLPPMLRLVRFEQSEVYGRIQLETKIAKQEMAKAVAKAKAKKAKAAVIEEATLE